MMVLWSIHLKTVWKSGCCPQGSNVNSMSWRLCSGFNKLQIPRTPKHHSVRRSVLNQKKGVCLGWNFYFYTQLSHEPSKVKKHFHFWNSNFSVVLRMWCNISHRLTCLTINSQMLAPFGRLWDLLEVKPSLSYKDKPWGSIEHPASCLFSDCRYRVTEDPVPSFLHASQA